MYKWLCKRCNEIFLGVKFHPGDKIYWVNDSGIFDAIITKISFEKNGIEYSAKVSDNVNISFGTDHINKDIFIEKWHAEAKINFNDLIINKEKF